MGNLAAIDMGGCVAIGSAIVNRPPRLARRRVAYCPIDKRRTRQVIRYGGAWYSPIVQCCACGDSWSDGELGERPFKRGWREEAKRNARRTWTEAVSPAEYRRHVDADIKAALA